MPRVRSAEPLSKRDRWVLSLERDYGPTPQAMTVKLAEAQRELGLSADGYVLIVNALIDDPAALAHDPSTVARLREVREARRAALQHELDVV